MLTCRRCLLIPCLRVGSGEWTYWQIYSRSGSITLVFSRRMRCWIWWTLSVVINFIVFYLTFMVRNKYIIIIILQFSRFLQSDFCKMLVRGLSKRIIKRIFEFLPTKNLAHWPSWCFEKNPTFFGTPTLSVCQIFCRQKFKNLSIQIVDKPLSSILPKPFVKILKTVEEDRKLLKV